MQHQRYRHVRPLETSGYFVKTHTFPPIRRKYFYRLSGAALTQHYTEESTCPEKLIILGATTKEHSRNGFILRLGQTNYVFYARNTMTCRIWMAAMKEAARFRIDRFYEVRELIGEGCFAKVHAAYDRETGAKAAEKTLVKGTEPNDFFEREISILRQLNHPNVVRTLDIFESNESYQIVMEFMSGGSLFDKVLDTVRFEEEEVRRLMRQILDGLAYVHSKGIVHRDMKPDNTLLTSDGQVKIADSGIARFYDASSKRLMKTIIGTPQYIAPELIQNEAYGTEVDSWPCGIILCSLATGSSPFSNDIVERYRKNWIIINWNRPGWREFSPDAKKLTKMLLCTNQSHRVSHIGALHHQWFQQADDLRAPSRPNIPSCPRAARQPPPITIDPTTEANLRTLRKWVHAIRFLRKSQRKVGKTTPFETKDV